MLENMFVNIVNIICIIRKFNKVFVKINVIWMILYVNIIDVLIM